METPTNHTYDIAIVGAGIVGLATAREFLLRNPRLRLIVLEKEPVIVGHQSGHNSGVIHSGIYYKPGSLKARLCVAGHRSMIDFCRERGMPYAECGKVIVALDESELPRLQDLYERGTANGVQRLELIGSERLREIEPHVVGIKAIYSPTTGIVDYTKVAQAYADDIRKCGGEILTSAQVTGIETRGLSTVLHTVQGDIDSKLVITCAGLYSDKIAQMTSGTRADVKIVPFRGSYYNLRPERRDTVRALIYPVPDPRFPFLGVHFTRVLNGEVWVGPNAVLAFAREGYRRWTIRPGELLETLTFPGFWKMVSRYWKAGIEEMVRDYVKSAYVKTAQRYIPELDGSDLIDGPSGVRAQAMDRDGNLVDDFLIKQGANVVHVQNAPSPAATSSLVIGKMIADEAQKLQ